MQGLVAEFRALSSRALEGLCKDFYQGLEGFYESCLCIPALNLEMGTFLFFGVRVQHKLYPGLLTGATPHNRGRGDFQLFVEDNGMLIGFASASNSKLHKGALKLVNGGSQHIGNNTILVLAF